MGGRFELRLLSLFTKQAAPNGLMAHEAIAERPEILKYGFHRKNEVRIKVFIPIRLADRKPDFNRCRYIRGQECIFEGPLKIVRARYHQLYRSGLDRQRIVSRVQQAHPDAEFVWFKRWHAGFPVVQLNRLKELGLHRQQLSVHQISLAADRRKCISVRLFSIPGLLCHQINLPRHERKLDFQSRNGTVRNDFSAATGLPGVKHFLGSEGYLFAACVSGFSSLPRLPADYSACDASDDNRSPFGALLSGGVWLSVGFAYVFTH
jgi:hypothetical protein